jgi:glutaredoxin
MTKMYADKIGVSYVERALSDSPDILAKAVQAGYTSAPVVVDDHGDIWGGYNPSKIRGRHSAK